MKNLIIIFDLDDTLILEESQVKKAFLKTCKLAKRQYKINVDSFYKTIKEKSKDLWYSLETKEYAVKNAISSWEALWGDFSGDAKYLIDIRKIIDEYRLKSWHNSLFEFKVDDIKFSRILADKFIIERSKLHKLFPESLNVLKKLSKKYKLGLLTNGVPGIQWEKINKTGIKKYFTHIVISGEFGISKPEKEIFLFIMNKFSTTENKIIYIGNSPKSDINGAKNAGFYAVWINREKLKYDGALQPDATITNLKGIYKIIEKF